MITEEVVQGCRDVSVAIPKAPPRDDQARNEEKDLTAEWVWVNEEDIKILVIYYQ
jgi:hypothetical protein